MIRLQLDCSRKLRPIGDLNGMTNGPLTYFGDFSEQFRDMGIRVIRLHETHARNTNCVEIPYIFRDFDADENDPANYYFAATDAVITAAKENNIEIIYRLGMGTEATEPRVFCNALPDYEKWARIAEHIISHYNEGWANGFHYNIRYWEIWNEPDLVTYWHDVLDEFTKFFGIASRYLKKRFPDLYFGGLSMAEPWMWAAIDDVRKKVRNGSWGEVNTYAEKLYKQGFIDDFMRRAGAGEFPLDFLSWHLYTTDPEEAAFTCDYVNRQMEKVGLLGKIENINTEWNSISMANHPYWKDGKKYNSTNWAIQFAPENKITALSIMMIMQKKGVSKATYYDSDSRGLGALFGYDGKPENHYYAFKAFSLLREAPMECEITGEEGGVYACASADEAKSVVIIANNNAESKQILLDSGKTAVSSVSALLLDGSHDLTDYDAAGLQDGSVAVTLPPYSAVVLRLNIG